MSIDQGSRARSTATIGRVHRADRAALDVALRWAAQEGWRPGRHDAAAFAAVDPGGLLSVRCEGRVASTLVAARYGPAFGAIGLYLTDPELRHRGYGTAVMDAGLEHLSRVATVGLDGVAEREWLYATLGFARAHATTRWTTGGSTVSLPVPGPRRPHDGLTVTDGRTIGPGALDAYEQRVRAFPAPRRGFLAAWLEMPESVSRVALDARGAVRGWGAVRRCDRGAKVAPLMADDAHVAARLLDELLAVGRGWGETTIDVPDPHVAARELVEDRGLTPEWACVRMYRGPAPDLDLDRVWGLTSFELG